MILNESQLEEYVVVSTLERYGEGCYVKEQEWNSGERMGTTTVSWEIFQQRFYEYFVIYIFVSRRPPKGTVGCLD